MTMLDQMQAFFSRLSAFNQSQAGDFQARFRAFGVHFAPILEQETADRRATAPDFNIFRYFGFQDQEAFHSDFLRFLLDPYAKHEQGTLFVETLPTYNC